MPKRKRKTTGWCCCHFGNYSSFVNWIIHFSIHQPLFVCFSSTNIIFRNEVDKGQIRQQWWVSSHDNVAAASTCWKLDNRKRNSDFQSFPPCTSLLCSPSLSQLLFYLHFLAYRTQNVCLSRPILAILLRTYALCTFTCLNNAVVYQNWQIWGMPVPFAYLLREFFFHRPLKNIFVTKPESDHCHWLTESLLVRLDWWRCFLESCWCWKWCWGKL